MHAPRLASDVSCPVSQLAVSSTGTKSLTLVEAFRPSEPVAPITTMVDLSSHGSDSFILDDSDLTTSIKYAGKFCARFGDAWFHSSSTEVAAAESRISTILGLSRITSSYNAAEVAANHFTLPLEAFYRDEADLISLGSLEALVRERQNREAHHRFNPQRCLEIFGNDPELGRLLTLATSGAWIDTHQELLPNGSPGPLRPAACALKHTLQHHAFALWNTGQAIILPVPTARSLGLHFSPIHWVPKVGKPLGRLVCDLSSTENDCIAVNDSSVKPLIEARFGPIELPSISDIARMVVETANNFGGFLEIMLWKDDVASAYNQLNFDPLSVRWLAFVFSEASADHPALALITYTGNFGWQGSPAAYDVIRRAIDRTTRPLLGGAVMSYVDDYIGVAHKSQALADQTSFQDVVTRTFGEGGLNREKSIGPSRSCECIGWVIDLDSVSVFPNEKGIHKLTSCFFGLRLHKRLSRRQFQIMGSLASRYSAAIRGARPFVRVFFAHCHIRSPVRATSEVKFAVLVWRAITLVLITNPRRLAVPLTDIAQLVTEPDVNLQTDAGPEGLGLELRSKCGRTIAFLSYRFPFLAVESKYQNIREFLGIVFGMAITWILFPHVKHIAWFGDNTSSLAWAQHNYTSSKPAQAAFYFFSWISITSQIRFSSINHIPGVSMGQVDNLSRFRPTNYAADLNCAPRLPLYLFDQLATLCDPTSQSSSLHEAEALLASAILWCHQVANLRRQ